MSIHFLRRMGIEIGDGVTAGFGRGFAFATSIHLTLTLGLHIYVDNSNPRSCSVSKQRFDQHFNTVAFLAKTDFHIQDPGDFSRFRESTLSLGMLFLLRSNVLST